MLTGLFCYTGSRQRAGLTVHDLAAYTGFLQWATGSAGNLVQSMPAHRNRYRHVR